MIILWFFAFYASQSLELSSVWVLSLNFAEAVRSRMRPDHWFLVVFLAFVTAELCCSGPLHAQCKVEWYTLFLLEDTLIEDVFGLKKYNIAEFCTKWLSKKTLGITTVIVILKPACLTKSLNVTDNYFLNVLTYNYLSVLKYEFSLRIWCIFLFSF